MKPRYSQQRNILGVRLRALADHFQENLFLLPALCVVGAVVLAQVLLKLDAGLSSVRELNFLSLTLSSAQALLSTIASAIITVASLVLGFVFITLQIASSQFSPRVLGFFYRNRFQQSVMGLSMGTFTYCLMVLRAMPAPDNGSGEAIVPSLSVTAAVIFGVAAVLVILAYVNYIAHALRVGDLIDHITDRTIAGIRHLPLHQVRSALPLVAQELPPDSAGYVVRARQSGWVQQAPPLALLEAIPAGSLLRLDVRVGTFIPAGRPLCTVWPVPDDSTRVERTLREVIQLGRARTMQEDLPFGIRQISDIALRALSPAVNDPTTAYEAIVHLGAMLRELLLRDLPLTSHSDQRGRRLVRPHEFAHADYVNWAFDQIRQAGASQPAIVFILMRTLGMLKEEVEAAGMPDRVVPLQKQAELILATCKATCLLPEDLEQVYVAARKAGFQLDPDRRAMLATPSETER